MEKNILFGLFGGEMPDTEKSEIVKISHLVKRFGDLTAVDDISFEVRRGELFAFLGVNGAGKSTTISVICGQLRRDGGTVVVNGADIDKDSEAVRRNIGVVFQASALDKVLSVKENLKARAALYGIFGNEFETRYTELDKLLGLKELERRTVGKLSGGQRRRADIARALLHKPKILILDEPTTGLDPQTRKVVWDVIGSLRKSGEITVFLTTHYMEEAADADRVVILNAGKIVAGGTPNELKNKYTGDFISFYDKSESELAVLGKPLIKIADGYRIEVANTSAATALIKKYPELFTDYEVCKGKMDDVFLAATGIKAENV